MSTLVAFPRLRLGDRAPSVSGSEHPRRRTVERFAIGAMTVTFAAQPAVRPNGPGNSSPIDLLVLLSLIAVAVSATTARLRLRAPYILGAGLMILAGALAGVNGPMPAPSLVAVVQDIILITWCTAVVAVASNPGRLRLLAAAWSYSAMAYAAVVVVGALLHVTAITGVVAREGNRVLFTFGDPNYAATYWALSIFIVYAAKVPHPRWLRWTGYGLLLWTLVLTESNGGAVELMAGCFLLLLVAVYRQRGLVAITALLLVLLGAALVTTSQLASISSIQTWARQSGQPLLVNSLGRSNESSAQRSQLLDESFELYATDGVLGSGPGTTKELLADRGYAYAKEAHDDYLASLTERGPLGVLGMVALVSSAIWRSGRVLMSHDNSPGTGLPRPVGLVSALVAVAIAATYYEVLHFRFVWGLLALVAAAAYASPSPRRRPAAPAERVRQ
jgi:hypothetical protein